MPIRVARFAIDDHAPHSDLYRKHPVSTTEGPRRSSAGLAAAFLELLA